MNTPLREIENWTGHRQPGGGFPWFRVMLLAFIAILIAAVVTGCGTEYPVALSVRSDYGRVTYSSKGGLEIEVEK